MNKAVARRLITAFLPGAVWGYSLSAILAPTPSVFFAAASGIATAAAAETLKLRTPLRTLWPLFLAVIVSFAVRVIADPYSQHLLRIFAGYFALPLTLALSLGFSCRQRDPENPRAANPIFYALWSIYAIWLMWLSWTHFQNLWTHSNFSHLLYNLGQGRATITLTDQYVPMHFLAWHLSPNWLLLAPLYRLFDHHFIPSFLQVVSIALGALPIYLLARNRLKNQALACAITLGYFTTLIFPLAILKLVTDRGMSVAFCSWMIYFMLQNRKRLFWIFLFLFLGWGEANAFVTAGLALYLLSRRQWKMASAVMAVSLADYFAARHLGTRLNQGFYLYETLQSHARGLLLHPAMLVHNMVTPQTLVIALCLALSGSYIAVFSPLAWAVLPALFLNFFSEMTRDLATAYGYAPLVPIVCFAAILTLHRWQQKPPKLLRHFSFTWALCGLHICGVCLLSAPTYISLYYDGRFESPARTENIKRIAAEIPRTASLTATSMLEGTLSAREIVYEFPPPEKRTKKEIDRSTDYVAVDVNDPWISEGEHNADLQALFRNSEYGVWRYDVGFIIFKRGERGTLLDQILVNSGRVAPLTEHLSNEPLELVSLRVTPQNAAKNTQVRVDYVWKMNTAATDDLWVITEFSRSVPGLQEYLHREVHKPLYGLLSIAAPPIGALFRDSVYLEVPASTFIRREPLQISTTVAKSEFAAKKTNTHINTIIRYPFSPLLLPVP